MITTTTTILIATLTTIKIITIIITITWLDFHVGFK
jgi:hypothetical protein